MSRLPGTRGFSTALSTALLSISGVAGLARGGEHFHTKKYDLVQGYILQAAPTPVAPHIKFTTAPTTSCQFCQLSGVQTSVCPAPQPVTSASPQFSMGPPQHPSAQAQASTTQVGQTTTATTYQLMPVTAPAQIVHLMAPQVVQSLQVATPTAQIVQLSATAPTVQTQLVPMVQMAPVQNVAVQAVSMPIVPVTTIPTVSQFQVASPVQVLVPHKKWHILGH